MIHPSLMVHPKLSPFNVCPLLDEKSNRSFPWWVPETANSNASYFKEIYFDSEGRVERVVEHD